MRLLSLTLNGRYKGLNDQHFDFQHTQGNILAFIGLNGSGKSQLLELIGEIFAFLERKQRSDFRVKTTLGFGFELFYQLSGTTEHSFGSSGMQFDSPLAVMGGVNLPKFKVLLEDKSKEPEAFIYVNGAWNEIGISKLELPFIVGYSSGLNENLQRSFMKNAVQHYDIMRIRLKRQKELTDNLNEEQISGINKRYLKRYPNIFQPEETYQKLISSDGHQLVTSDGYVITASNLLLSLRETDTPSSRCMYLDYDSAALFLFSSVLLPETKASGKLDDGSFKRPVSVILEYDLRREVAGLDSVRDIRALVRIAGSENLEGIGQQSTDEQYQLYELNFLAGQIFLDLTDSGVLEKLREANYNDPMVLFRRLYKFQQLGVKNWQGVVRQQLRKDNFTGTVKKPLKTKLPLSVIELTLSDGNGNNASFDDLSDGEAQFIQVMAAVKIFSKERTLFLLDEPETHSNPSWRTYFHSHLTNALMLPEQEDSKTQIFATTHSPFMVSSLQREDVFLFKKDVAGKINMEPVANQTYGASFEVLIKEYFNLQSLISQTVVKDIKAHLPKDESTEERQKAKRWITDHIGESMEKAYLLRKLQD